MSERGVFAVDRGIWDHPSFADEPLTEREAWQWLIGEAAFKDRVRRVGSVVVELVRGQLAASTRFMADKWQWSEARVRRFLKRLKTDAMIDAASDAGITVITICNYNKYQRVSLPNDAATVAPNDAAATQQRRKTEDTKTIETDSEAKASAPSAPIYTDSRHELWGEGPAILVSLGVPDKLARSNIGRWLKTMRDDAQAVLGAIQRARDHRIHDPVPWITNALKGPQNVDRNSINRTHQAAGPPQTRDAAVIASMARTLERRRQERAANQPGDEGLPRGDGPAGGADAEPGPPGGDDGACQQLAFLPRANAGQG